MASGSVEPGAYGALYLAGTSPCRLDSLRLLQFLGTTAPRTREAGLFPVMLLVTCEWPCEPARHLLTPPECGKKYGTFHEGHRLSSLPFPYPRVEERFLAFEAGAT